MGVSELRVWANSDIAKMIPTLLNNEDCVRASKIFYIIFELEYACINGRCSLDLHEMGKET